MKKLRNKKRIMFTYYTMSSFVENDLEILQKHYDVKTIKWHGKKDLFKMIINTFKSDLTYSWFAGDHAFATVLISKLLRKKSIVIVGGFDVARVPELNYGRFTQGWFKKSITKFVLKNATRVLVVDPSLKEDAIKNAKISGKNIEYLPTGYDSDYWMPKRKKEDTVLTVGGVNEIIVIRKGFDTFVKAAKHLPDVKFVLVGKHYDDSINKLKEIAPSNVEFTGFVTDEELLAWYQKAKVYCQLSRYEGLPNALCEAMLCECVPVGTKYCGIPTGIGDTGFYVPFGDEKATAEGIKKALEKPGLGKKARDRIKTHFPLSLRARELVKIISEISKKNNR